MYSKRYLFLTTVYPLATSRALSGCTTFSLLNHNSPKALRKQFQTRFTSSEVLSHPEDQMPPTTRSSLTVRVVSYNILSSHLASPTHHTKCDPNHLEASVRLPKILMKLQGELEYANSINEPVIFCIQEVSHDWAAALHAFFAERNYHLVTALYGKKFNGYMGIATAYPMDKFETLQVDLCRLSDKKQGGWPRAPPSPDQGIVRKYVLQPFYNSVVSTVKYFRGSKPESENPWDYSQWRMNQFIGIKLKPRDRSQCFWIGNYHMPCAFWAPAVMNIHADLVSTRIQSLAGSDEFILAGDFNILPHSPHYQLLRTGKIDEDDLTFPPDRYGVSWKSSFQGMKSAYFEFNGKEPSFTNNAHNGALDAESFIGTLDYIFLSDNIAVLDVKEVPAIESLKGVYPDENEPSDHLMIAASLRL